MHMLCGINIFFKNCMLLFFINFYSCTRYLCTMRSLDEYRDGVCLLLIPKDSKVEFDDVRIRMCKHTMYE